MASGKAKWTDEMVHAMLGSLSQSVKEGKRGENGFKKEAWQKTRIATNAVYGTKLDLTQCKTKYASLKADYCTFHKLRENSGFGWNEENGIPTAAEGVWDEYIAKHPEAAKFRQKPFAFYAEMDEICSGHTATGQYAYTAAEVMAKRVERQAESEDSGTTNTPGIPDLVFEGEGDNNGTGVGMAVTSAMHMQGKGQGK